MRGIEPHESPMIGDTMNRTHKAALLAGTALGAVAVLAAPVAAQAAPAPAVQTKAHTTIAGWGHNQSAGMPVQIHGNSITRHLAVKPGGVRTLEVNDATCIVTPGGQSQCTSKVLEVVKTNSKGKLTLTLPVHTTVDEYSIFARGTKNASTAETVHWDVYKV